MPISKHGTVTSLSSGNSYDSLAKADFWNVVVDNNVMVEIIA